MFRVHNTYTRTYIYLGVTFIGPQFFLHKAACARLSSGYTVRGALERQRAHLQFQESWPKLWPFHTLSLQIFLIE